MDIACAVCVSVSFFSHSFLLFLSVSLGAVRIIFLQALSLVSLIFFLFFSAFNADCWSPLTHSKSTTTTMKLKKKFNLSEEQEQAVKNLLYCKMNTQKSTDEKLYELVAVELKQNLDELQRVSLSVLNYLSNIQTRHKHTRNIIQFDAFCR